MKCKYCGCEEFYAHQVCRHDVVVDGDGNYIDDQNGRYGDSVYDSETPYGPFACITCGAEYRALKENAHCSGPQFPYGRFHYRNWAPIREENGVIEVTAPDSAYNIILEEKNGKFEITIEVTAPDSAYNIILEEKNGKFEITKIQSCLGHPKLTPEYACGVLCDINIEMPAGYGSTLGYQEADEFVKKLTSAMAAVDEIEAYIRHVNEPTRVTSTETEVL